MRKLTVAVMLTILVAVAIPLAAIADGGEQVFPTPPYKIIQVRWGGRGHLYYYGVPTGRYAKDVFANPQTRYVYWRNTDGEYRYFKLPDGCSMWLAWKERILTRKYFWWGSYEYQWRSQKILGPRY